MVDLRAVILLNEKEHFCDHGILETVIDYLTQIKKDKSLYEDRESLKINFLLWKNMLNIYIGERGAHYADDVKIASQKQIEKLIEHLDLLLKGKVVESVYSFGKDDKKYIYELTYKTNNKKFSNITLYPSFILTRHKNTYQPWIY